MDNSSDKLLYEKIVRRLLKHYKIYAIILFGSRARGDYNKWSDYDILILGDFKEPYFERLRNILEIFADMPNVEPHPYTLRESIEMLKKGNLIIYDALEEGKILYEENEMKKLKDLFKELKQRGMEKTKTSIKIP